MAARMAKAGSEDKPAKKAKAKTGTKKAPASPYERPRGGEPSAIADLVPEIGRAAFRKFGFIRSDEHPSELQSLMRISYAVFCLKTTNTQKLPIRTCT